MKTPGSAGGFTLLELVVAMALMGLLTGLVGPRSLEALEAARARADARTVVNTIESLPLEAFRSGQALELDAQALQTRLQTAGIAGAVKADQPLRYSAEGYAQGAILELSFTSGRKQVFRVSPVTGLVTSAAS